MLGRFVPEYLSCFLVLLNLWIWILVYYNSMICFPIFGTKEKKKKKVTFLCKKQKIKQGIDHIREIFWSKRTFSVDSNRWRCYSVPNRRSVFNKHLISQIGIAIDKYYWNISMFVKCVKLVHTIIYMSVLRIDIIYVVLAPENSHENSHIEGEK